VFLGEPVHHCACEIDRTGMVVSWCKLHGEAQQQITELTARLDERQARITQLIEANTRLANAEERARAALAVGQADHVAREFHFHYEALAPWYGYSTRSETRVLNLDSPNGLLMRATARAVLTDRRRAAGFEEGA